MENHGISIPEENGILIDWLTVTFHDIDVSRVKQLLGLDAPDIDWDDRLAFQDGYPRQCSFMNIVIRYGADKVENYADDVKSSAADKVRFDMGISLNMSGTGCRSFETYSSVGWLGLLGAICSLDTRVKFTRLDLAYDDHTGILDIARIRQDVEDRYYTGVPKKSSFVWSDDQKQDIQGLTIYVGSRKSPVYFRIYDKAAERGFKDRHWVRVELVLRNARATAAIAEILKVPDGAAEAQGAGTVFSGVLRNYCCFREPTADTNKSRWPIADYWSHLINDAARIRLWISPGEPYNFRKTEDALIFQYGQAILTSYDIDGGLDHLLYRCRQAYPEVKKKYKIAAFEAKLEKQRARAALKDLRKKLCFSDPDQGFFEIEDQTDMAEIFGDALLPPSAL